MTTNVADLTANVAVYNYTHVADMTTSVPVYNATHVAGDYERRSL